MLDMQMLDRGQTYRKLNRSFIIFICLEDVFGYGRHIYTFENLCREDPGISMGDGTTKIFLNADSRMDDVGEELKAFLNYAAGKNTDNAFVRELDRAVKEAKQNREWRHEYMTLLMRDKANQEIGREIERQKIIIRMINQGFANNQIIMLCDTSEEEIEKCRNVK